MSERDLSVICQAIPVDSDVDVSTQASNIYFGISGIRETFDITSGQPQLYAPIVTQNLNVISCSNNTNNGAFGTVKLFDYLGTECELPFTAAVSYDNKEFTAISSEQYFLDGVSSFTYHAPVTPTPVVDLQGDTINFISPVSDVTLHAFVNDVEVTLPYTFQNLNETITCYGSKLGYLDSQTVSYTYTGLVSTITTINWNKGNTVINSSYATKLRPVGHTSYLFAKVSNGSHTITYNGAIQVEALGNNQWAMYVPWGTIQDGFFPSGSIGSSYVQSGVNTIKVSITNVTRGGTAVAYKNASAGFLNFSLPSGTVVGDIVIINIVMSKDPLQ